MKTISFNIKTSEEDKTIIENDSRVYSSIVRYCFNRFKDSLKDKEIYKDVIEKFNFSSHLSNSAMREAKGFYKLNKNKKVIFGNLKRYVCNLISKDEYKLSRNRGISSEGEAIQKGNRFFKINLIDNSIIFKRNKKDHIKLYINEKISSKRLKLLNDIHLAMVQKETPITFKIKNDKIYITYNEEIIEKYKKFNNLQNNRILGLDLNPNYIGLSILEFKGDDFKVIHKKVYDLSDLNELSTNKVKFELQQIDNQIINLCNHFKCSKLVVESLNFQKSNKFWSKKLNRLCRNKFRFSQISSHLNTLCNSYGVKYEKVNAAYSSFIGNFIHGDNKTPDMVAASIEIARRGYKKFSKEWFYPSMIMKERVKEVLGNQWKKELELSFKSWKSLYEEIKKLKIRYRFQLNENDAVFSKKNYKSSAILYNFL